MKMPAYFLALLLLLCPFAPRSAAPGVPPPLRPNRDYALFFAVNDYRPGSGFDPLTKPVANAEAIASELRERYGFATEVVKNPTLDQICTKLREYRDLFAKNPQGRYPASGQLLIYFTGHGIAENNNGYFVPTDGDLKKLYSTAFAYEIWRPFINSMDCRHILVAVDACYSVTFDPDWYSPSMNTLNFGRPGELSEGDKLLLTNESDKCRILFASDGREDKVPERSNFARKFLEGLQNGTRQDGVLTSTILAGYLDFAAPKPRITTFGGDTKGSFVFVSVKPRQVPLVIENTDDLARDLAAWRAAKNANTIAAYRQYLTDYTEGEFRVQASDAIRAIEADLALRRDDLAWDVATEKNTEQAYLKYQADFPQGRHYAEAGERIVSLRRVASAPEHMVHVRGGTFEMGDVMGDKEHEDEQIHTVTLSSFYLGKTEVTFNEYDAFCTATGREKLRDHGWGRSKRPVVDVDWIDAVDYCNWLSGQHNLKKVYTIKDSTVTANWSADGYRLPTEAEWEYAARSRGKRVRFGNGKDVADPKEINFTCDEVFKTVYSITSESRQMTVQVGSFSANELGLCDMSGNVREWCWDFYTSYPPGAVANPCGPGSGTIRVIRGGSWDTEPNNLRAAFRDIPIESDRGDDIGFRLARTARGE
ncbi:MAG: SUMF1/EgtB/PvdO family nonheme iron enzyme [Saprospiraceae bacterium]